MGKSPCQGCKDLVDGILKGLDKTKNKNFGGGDTAWEEKKNLKYKTSETRLVEILEGAGTCECDEGYSGDLCNECGPRHFNSFGNDTYTMCSPCAVGCETCLSANDTDCLTCSAGFTVDKTPKPAAPAPEAPKEEGSEEKKEK